MFEVTFGEKTYELSLSWKTSKEFCEKIGDPLLLAIEASKGNNVFTTDKVISAIYIGLKNAGEDMSRNEVAEMCHKHGIINYFNVATEYLIAIVTGESDTVEEDPGKK